MRKLAEIVKIDSINPIENADAIEAAKVGGWQIVVKKGEFNVGDLAVYFQIDSWVPNAIAPFLSKGEPREYNGVKGERLRTIKLRGTLSQGLLLPLELVFPMSSGLPVEGQDVAEILGVQKWEAPIPASLGGVARGNFPSLVPKTDADRIQGLGKELKQWIADDVKFEVTIKLDGSSMTVAKVNDTVHVCSRNLSLQLDQEGNTFVNVAKQYDLINLLQQYPKEIAIQGELIGDGIQGNKEFINGHDFYVFEVYDIQAGKYYSPEERYALCTELGLKHVPVLHNNVILSDIGVFDIDSALELADGPSLNAKLREGLVFKNHDGSIKWKAISNKWLLKNE